MPNHLTQETSPYLKQHENNPVDWYPWGDEAFTLARETDRPILLSVGYSACHWCHVMAHESFEDDDTAELMNRHFVNVKVDREERPDVDRIYQLAHQILSRRPGGWPLTVFLDPNDQSPFFVGTYFPSAPRHGMPAFRDLLEHIASAWQDQREAVQQQNAEFRALLERLNAPAEPAAEGDPANAALNTLMAQYDEANGGFGGAPKFPHPSHLRFLQRVATSIKPTDSMRMMRGTLDGMARGGVYDQLGGGFYRYSVDQYWAIPHFEKMLYDNGQLLSLYAWQAQLDDNAGYRQICEETFHWLERDMRQQDGAFYASLDADSEGGEGAYYVWTREQVESLAGAGAALTMARFGLKQPPNFEGRWHLFRDQSLAQLAAGFSIEEEEVESSLAASQKALLAHRSSRPAPGRDEKVIAAWNGMLITGLADCGRLLGQPKMTARAQQALDFVRDEMVEDDRLYSVWAAGKAKFPAYLDDYALLLGAALSLLQAHWRDRTFDFARWLADQLISRFEDSERGGFFFTAHDHEALLMRPKTFSDDATPNGNAQACLGLLSLGHLLGEPDYLRAVEKTLAVGLGEVARTPVAHLDLTGVLSEQQKPRAQLLIQCPDNDRAHWVQKLAAKADPRRDDYVVPQSSRYLGSDSPIPALTHSAEGKLVAQLCRGASCQAPVTDSAALWALLEQDAG